ncbi:PucR family transcriptional regulator [Mycolicibacterium rhodesiae]|uniref:Transcriptional regulator n=1 Tax=Mycolicibacterium rhodesiae TaxID=36814 RepID=A0A1X0IKN3_MYCRH|nr:PucR family transcriptional regulator [Mycolicibacterium rhodesiae]MCV7348472.1 PucR family transcriptional regulator [Mycolicibacterium rhodesiae]ORB48466.1 transcriptional regulator [Mycolicibacterium rhodesiae]
MLHLPATGSPAGWELPSERVRELMRQAAKRVVHTRQAWYDEADRYSLTSSFLQDVGGSLAEDPLAAEAINRSNRSNQLHWAAANISHPGEPVAANTDPETLAIARYFVRRGLDESAVVETYRRAQSVSLRFWMHTVFQLTSDADEMRQLFDVSERSITAFLGDTITAVHHQMEIERENLARGTYAERRETVALILDGAPLSQDRAETRLGYPLGQSHIAAIVWSNEADANLSHLDLAVELLLQTVRGKRSVSVLASADTRWVWLPGDGDPDFSRVAAALPRMPGVRIAVGSASSGMEGFRRSHLDAVSTQRLMTRAGFAQQIATFSDVQFIAMVSADPEQVNRFIKHTLGDFEHADPELQRTVLVYIDEQCNASQAAARLFTHRNTLMRRLAQARELLPHPMEGTTVHIALALEALRWRS